MTQFAVGQPVTTEAPVVTVDAGLPLGRHRFRLVVVGASGIESAADEAVLTIRMGGNDGPIDPIPIGPADPIGPIVPIGPADPAEPPR